MFASGPDFETDRWRNLMRGAQPPVGGTAVGGPPPPPGIPPKPGQGSVPPTQSGARPNRPALPGGTLYGGYSAEQLRANAALVSRLGAPAAARWAAFNKPGAPPPPVSGPPAPPSLAPSPPPAAGPSAAPGQNPWAPPPPAAGGGGPFGGGQAGEAPVPYAWNDPFNAFEAAIPLMNLNRDQQIADAMATAGFGGNRFGSYAAGKAAEIGAQNALAQNQLLLSTIGDYANRAEDRALAATGLGLQTGTALDRMQQDRLRLPFQLGSYEQQRQDDLARLAYEDFERNKLGWFGPLSQLAASQGAGSPGQIYQTTTDPGSPGLADWFQLLGGLF